MGTIKRTNGKIYGYQMTAAEKKAANMEILRQLAEFNRKNADEIDALFLWVMHDQFGFGHERLKRIHENFRPALDALCDRYEMTDRGDELWLCTHKLKEIGVDIAEWNKSIPDTK